MKNIRGIVIAVVILAILIGAYAIVTVVSNNKEENVTQTTAQTVYNLSSFDPEAVNKIEMVSNERTLLLELKDGMWYADKKYDIPVSQTLTAAVAKRLSAISSNTLVEENAKDLSVYGLDKPYKTTLSLEDGTKHTFSLGSTIPTGTGDYFIDEATGNVYILATTYRAAFRYTFPELVEKEVIRTVDTSLLSYVYIAQEGRPVLEVSSIEPGTIDQVEMWHSLSLWKMTKPYSSPRGIATGDAWSNLLTSMSMFNTSIGEYVSSDTKDWAKYGLDDPWLELNFKSSDENETHLYFGDETKTGTYIYYRQEGSNSIYTMAKTTVDAFVDIDAFDLTDKMAHIFYIDGLTKVTVTKGNEKHIFDVKTTKLDDGSVSLTCNVGSKSYPENDFRKLYQNIVGLMISSEYTGEKITGTPEVKISFTFTSGETVEAKYYKYDNNYYVFERNGAQDFLITQRQFDALFSRIAEFFNGTLVQE